MDLRSSNIHLLSSVNIESMGNVYYKWHKCCVVHSSHTSTLWSCKSIQISDSRAQEGELGLRLWWGYFGIALWILRILVTPLQQVKNGLGGGMTWPPGTQTCNVRPSKVDSQFIVPAHIRKLGYMNILIIAIFGGEIFLHHVFHNMCCFVHVCDPSSR